MTDYPLDIIIPVWNNPIAVRSALAAFAADSPFARLVMVNNGSERETEAILHEFAEALDDRALLLSTGKNIGTVAALNLGLSRSTAVFALVTNPFVRLTPGWFEPVRAVVDQVTAVGAVCLRGSSGAALEADHGSFSAMILTRELFLRSAGFDEQMDGAVWALRDFARRATGCGYKTFSVYCRQLQLENQQDFGSQSRREQRVQAAKELYTERWGDQASYLLNCTDSLPCATITDFRETLLEAARQGDRVMLTAASKLGRVLAEEGFSALHENISLITLPRFFAKRALQRQLRLITAAESGAVLITADEAPTPFSMDRLSYADFETRLNLRRERFYRGGNDA